MTKILVDANVLITYITPPPTDLEARKQIRVRDLFHRIYRGEAEAILPEVVLHETFYTMLGPRFPDTELPILCSTIYGLLEWPGWAMDKDELSIYHRAIDILEEHPRLEFSDAVIAARAEAHDAVLATFDKGLADAYGGPRWSDS